MPAKDFALSAEILAESRRRERAAARRSGSVALLFIAPAVLMVFVFLLAPVVFNVILSFEKRRETWELEGCKVELDELPHLGTYVEIEGPAEAIVLRVRGMLGLNDRGLVKASYAALLGEYVQERGLGKKVVSFDAQ